MLIWIPDVHGERIHSRWLLLVMRPFTCELDMGRGQFCQRQTLGKHTCMHVSIGKGPYRGQILI
jgi:hypothetical protein